MALKTEAEAREMARRFLEEAEFRRQEAEARGETFESLDEEALVKKIMGRAANTPRFQAQSMGSGPPGGTTLYTATTFNPDSREYSASELFAYLFFGPANFIQDTDTALTVVDTRFPRYFKGIDVAVGGSATAFFTVNIPSGITPGRYMANCVLVLRGGLDVGTCFDRAGISLKVT
jgi:hypothetical protein